MKTPSSITNSARQIAERQVFFLFWIAGIAFGLGLIVLLLLQRLGITLPLIISLIGAVSFVALALMSWQGRTMSSQPFFYAGRSINAAQLGVAGVTDWLGGTAILLLVGLSTTGQTLLAPAIMFALLLQAVLFAGPVQRSRTLTIPGFLGWRFDSKLLSFSALLLVCAVLMCILIAEFQVLRSVSSNLFNMGSDTLLIALLVAAALPSLIGGWSSLVLINGGLAIWMLASLLTTASTMAFMPDSLQAALALDPNTLALPVLPSFQADPFGFLTMLSTPSYASVVALLVIAFGLAIMPHGLSRLALNRTPLAASEATGWTALFVFLLFSAMPLSVSLMTAEPTSTQLFALIEKHVVFYALPHFAVLFAAFNALSVTLFIISISIVRTFRRGQSLDPGERSIFPTRLLIILIAAGLVYAPLENVPDSASLFFIGLSLLAGGFFAPVAASIWFSRIPSSVILMAILLGTGVTVLGLVDLLPLPAFFAAACGLVLSSVLLAATYIAARLRKVVPIDPPLLVLRQPDGA